MSKALRNLDRVVKLVIYYMMVYLLPIDKKVILFESSVGRNYSGNPKYIYREMVSQGLDKRYKCVWIFENEKRNIPGNCIKIRKFSWAYFYYLSVSKFWIFDSRHPRYLKKKSGCIYIQTWHGTPLKKLALDMEVLNMGGDTDLAKYKRAFYKNTRSWDYLISQNSYSSEIFKRAFAFDKKILEIGYPRNDILFQKNNHEYIESLRKRLGLPLNKKVILYAPTWRDDEYYEYGQYKFHLKIDLDRLMRELKNEYVIILKVHYLIVDQLNFDEYKDFVFFFNRDEDIQELYLAADILITDYSSVMFDFSILKKPMIFFAYDLEKYKEKIRGFYFDLEKEAPGPIVKTNEDLVKAILRANTDLQETYQEAYQKFSKKYNVFDDGQASQKVIHLINSLISRG